MSLMVAEVYEALIEAGTSEQKAKAAAGAIPVAGELATKEDLRELRDELRDEMGERFGKLERDMAVLKFAYGPYSQGGGGYKRMPRERARSFTATSISRPSRTIVSLTVSPPALSERACDMTRRWVTRRPSTATIRSPPTGMR